MGLILIIVAFLLFLDLLFWFRADQVFRRLPRPGIWRSLLAVFMALQAIFLLAMMISPESVRASTGWMPKPIIVAGYIWHLGLLLVSLMLWIVIDVIGQIIGKVRKTSKDRETASGAGTTRRQFLTAVAVATPPLLTVGATVASMAQMSRFRIQKFDLSYANLPPDLDGLSIAHVSDTHIGTFTEPKMLPAIIDATNKLRADLVLFTGDLINLSISDLPAGIDMLKKMDARQGVYAIEGNHDLLDDRERFETTVRRSGVPLLLDDATTLKIRGHPVQLLGTRWGRFENSMQQSMAQIARRRNPDAFAILMAHHPHVWDHAIDQSIPLTLSGHTHGGQIMLTGGIGFGPAMYKYWSGLYESASTRLVVSNGIGHWFPLRINAPAEIVHVVLHRA